jgi:hypothetical protein
MVNHSFGPAHLTNYNQRTHEVIELKAANNKIIIVIIIIIIIVAMIIITANKEWLINTNR